jgi:hypothetical protein
MEEVKAESGALKRGSSHLPSDLVIGIQSSVIKSWLEIKDEPLIKLRYEMGSQDFNYSMGTAGRRLQKTEDAKGGGSDRMSSGDSPRERGY